MRIAAAALLAAAGLACGEAEEPTYTSTPPNGSSDVVITGDAFPAPPTGWRIGSLAVFEAAACSQPAGWGRMVLWVQLSWTPEMCRMLQHDEKHVGTGFVHVNIALDRFDGLAVFPPGTYPITHGYYEDVLDGRGVMSSRALVYRYGPMCYISEFPGDGSVTITSADEAGVTGRVDLSFSDGSTAVGAFAAPVCDQGGDVCRSTAIHRVADDASCLP